jgi:hypothetical protein
MAGTLIQSEFVFRSGSPSELYTFTIVSNSQGNLSLRDLQNPYGFIISPYSQVPQSVTNDISAAMAQVENILASVSPISGVLIFTNENTKTYTFASALASASYRVHLSPDAFVPLRVIAQTTTSFTVQAAASFTGTVGFDVFV